MGYVIGVIFISIIIFIGRMIYLTSEREANESVITDFQFNQIENDIFKGLDGRLIRENGVVEFRSNGYHIKFYIGTRALTINKQCGYSRGQKNQFFARLHKHNIQTRLEPKRTEEEPTKPAIDLTKTES